MNRSLDKLRLGVIGLGYVGLPLAVEFGKVFPTVGFDVKQSRVDELSGGRDSTLEVPDAEIRLASRLSYTSDPAELADCNFYVVTVPTPVGDGNRPELLPLRKASQAVGRVLGPGDIVVYESTVYPGATEEYCVPFLEEASGLRLNEDFFVGYSPERINPGDAQHRLPSILKITSGSTPEVADFVDEVYRSIIRAGTHKASSIRVAEAAKVIENTQRDVNIALVNELAMIFERVGIDTEEVLTAAQTKWNFVRFNPGLVGGHCIGVDPHYLAYKAQQLGYSPEVILAGRRINENMSIYVASRIVKLMLSRKIQPLGSRILVLGLTFKENCPDIRNTKVIDMVRELDTYGAKVDIHDPWAAPEEARTAYGIDLVVEPASGEYDAIVLAVAHRQFRELGASGIRAYGREGAVLYDLKYLLPQGMADDRL